MRLDDVPRELLAAIAVAALVWALASAGRSWVRGARRRTRFARGLAGEREAADLLEKAGWSIEGAQVAAEYELTVDGARASVAVRADYVVVSPRGERFVAEVKTGRAAPRLETAATRRQLLEYQHAFGVLGVLLVDADARTIRTVTFAPPAPPAARRALVLAAAVMAALAWLAGSRLFS